MLAPRTEPVSPLGHALAAAANRHAAGSGKANTAQSLTPPQRHVLDYLRVFLLMNDQLPPCSVIAKAFGWSSENAAHTHMVALERKGYLVRNEISHLMLADRQHAHAAEHAQQLAALRVLANDLRHPEALGYAVTAEVRERARAALDGRLG